MLPSVIPESVLVTEFPKVTVKDKVSKVIQAAREYKIYVVPVVDDQDRLIGLVTYRDLLEHKVSLNAKVKSVLERPHKVREDDDITTAAKRVYELRLRQIPVVDKNGKIVALLSRDKLAKYVIEQGLVEDRPIKYYATYPAIVESSDALVAKVRWTMLRNGISRVPIVEGDKLVGIVTMRDIIEKLYYVTIMERSTVGEVAGSEEELLAAPVKAIMTYPVITAREDDVCSSVIDKLIQHSISGLPVLDNEGRVVAVFSSVDVLKRYLDKVTKVEIPIQVSLEFELPEDKHKMLEKIVSNYYAKLARLVDIIDFKLDLKIYECTGTDVDKRCKYSVHALLKDEYTTHTINVVDWDPVKAVRDALHLLHRSVLKYLKRLRVLRRRAKKHE